MPGFSRPHFFVLWLLPKSEAVVFWGKEVKKCLCPGPGSVMLMLVANLKKIDSWIC